MHWRNTGNQATIAGLDARLAYTLLAMLLHWSWLTFNICAVTIIVFAALRYQGYTLPNALRALRARLAGPRCARKPFWREPEMRRYPRI